MNAHLIPIHLLFRPVKFTESFNINDPKYKYERPKNPLLSRDFRNWVSTWRWLRLLSWTWINWAGKSSMLPEWWAIGTAETTIPRRGTKSWRYLWTVRDVVVTFTYLHLAFRHLKSSSHRWTPKVRAFFVVSLMVLYHNRGWWGLLMRDLSERIFCKLWMLQMDKIRIDHFWWSERIQRLWSASGDGQLSAMVRSRDNVVSRGSTWASRSSVGTIG